MNIFVSRTYRGMNDLFTCHNELQVEGVLSGPVAGDAGVDAGVAAAHGLDDQRVDAVLPHQHLVGRVGADGLSVQLPDEVWGGEATHLWEGERERERAEVSTVQPLLVLAASLLCVFIGRMKTAVFG